jgi:hypothetical protein
MMIEHTGNASSLRWTGRWQEVGRRQGAAEVVVIRTDSVALVWFVSFLSKRFVNVFTWHITDDQMIVSNDLIIKSLILDFSSLSDYQTA